MLPQPTLRGSHPQDTENHQIPKSEEDQLSEKGYTDEDLVKLYSSLREARVPLQIDLHNTYQLLSAIANPHISDSNHTGIGFSQLLPGTRTPSGKWRWEIPIRGIGRGLQN